MDTGIWILRCRECKQTFELEVTDASADVVELIRTVPCRHCNHRPDRLPDSHGKVNWHEIVKYSSTIAR